MKKYLPIGSVVLLEGGKKRLMIYGRIQQQEGADKIWDYIGCLYPEGHISKEFTYLFNHDDIEKVFNEGYRDEEEEEFQEILRAALEEGLAAE